MPLLLRIAFYMAAGLLVTSCSRMPDLASATPVHSPPRIDPDYTSLVIPPNIAPLNFRIKEEGRDFVVKISSEAAPPLEIHCPNGTCQIGLKPWRNMLQSNKGKPLYYDIYVKKQDGTWVQFQRITNTVAEEPIDPYIAFRLFLPNKNITLVQGVFQRNLETFERSTLVTRHDGAFECFGCHTFHQYDPDKFIFYIRMKNSGMMLVADGKVRKIETKQGPMFRPMAFASWHPDGRHIAATQNLYISYAPSTERLYYFEATGKRGDLVVYNVENNTLSTSEEVFGNEYIETLPCWSPDGKYIYFVRSRDVPLTAYEDTSELRYDLMRISYDTATDTWGSPETVMAYSELGTSCAFPRPSPCGRYILHILADKVDFPIHQRSADLYLLDLQTKEYRSLDKVNSDLSESYPRWSSNGRWLSFESNRRDGLSALPYFAYFDAEGQAHKAFVLPQKDPAYYDTFIDTYNVVEFVKSKIRISPSELARAMQGPAEDAVFLNPPEAEPYTHFGF